MARASWDLDVEADLSQVQQLLIALKATDPTALAQVTLFFRSGRGWFRLGPVAVGVDWAETVLDKSQAATEGTPTGWHAIDGVRLSLSPGERRDVSVDLAELRVRDQLPLSHVGAVGGQLDLAGATLAFAAQAEGRAQQADVTKRLDQATLLSRQAAGLNDAQDSAWRNGLIREGRARMAEAYAMLQTPKPDEFRGLWLHDGDGVRAAGTARVKRWKEALPEMAALGYNAVLPNVLWSGVAFYPSSVVPNHAGVRTDGDYLQEILDAAKPLGMKVHAWKVMWQFSDAQRAPPGVAEPFRQAGRLQLDAHGRELPWLCPCDERNQRYELDAIQELASRYAVDGIHLDYIRWSGNAGSFTPACREGFEAWSRSKVVKWPQDVLEGGQQAAQWQDYMRDVVTGFVRRTRLALKAIRPGLELSVAVFPDATQARQSVQQDWPMWAAEGLIDWLATMTYTQDAAGFKAAVQRQQATMRNPAVKLYPGVQFTLDAGRVLALESAVDQVRAVRALGLGGFVAFEWRDTLLDTIAPYLRAGLLRPGGYMPVAGFLRQQPADARPVSPERGRALALSPSADGSLLLDDFEDGDLRNRAGGQWGLDIDASQMGTLAGPLPLRTQPGGALGSQFSLGFKGHLGPNRAPWSYALLHTSLSADRAPVDLSSVSGLRFLAKGDGGTYQVVLRQRVVKDSGYFRAVFKATRNWSLVTLRWSDFRQPGWAQPVESQFSDVSLLEFSPSGLSDEDFELSIDQMTFLP